MNIIVYIIIPLASFWPFLLCRWWLAIASLPGTHEAVHTCEAPKCGGNPRIQAGIPTRIASPPIPKKDRYVTAQLSAVEVSNGRDVLTGLRGRRSANDRYPSWLCPQFSHGFLDVVKDFQADPSDLQEIGPDQRPELRTIRHLAMCWARDEEASAHTACFFLILLRWDPARKESVTSVKLDRAKLFLETTSATNGFRKFDRGSGAQIQ
ncbi:hypothetical protein BV898_15384 [Hypsibius exemplaris]|uniref:Uncharacterized protein n=1 Tax=Hypsibius exemplaris TaxID=2072580 RepID=A0A9X6NDT5_HYPEX|nr:hypothetical protein BV898_15384 [Hypsibius exemplaris]